MLLTSSQASVLSDNKRAQFHRKLLSSLWLLRLMISSCTWPYYDNNRSWHLLNSSELAYSFSDSSPDRLTSVLIILQSYFMQTTLEYSVGSRGHLGVSRMPILCLGYPTEFQTLVIVPSVMSDRVT